MFGLLRNRRRRRLLEQPFPESWREILARNLPFYRRLTDADRETLERHVRIFVAEKHFEGAEGVEVTDEMRVTIAGQASLLLLGRESDTYPNLVSVIVYPGAYSAETRRQAAPGIVDEGSMARLGEAWPHGAVVVAWDHVRRGAADPRDGHNLVLHEFAHLLDQEDGVSDGTPVLPNRGAVALWARILGAEYEQLRRELALGRSGLLDAYGATNPAEFFAVATEIFFERPAALRRTHAALYEELREFYRMEPESLLEPDTGIPARGAPPSPRRGDSTKGSTS